MSYHVVVTGGAGFIGGHLCARLLQNGHTVTAIDNFDPFYDRSVKVSGIAEHRAHPRFRLLELDIEDTECVREALRGDPIDAIIHLAAKAGVRPSIEQPMAYQRTNVLGTQSIFEIARDKNVQAVLFGSSSSVYGNTTPVPFHEDSVVSAPISPYAATKRAGELMGHTFYYLHGVSVHCLRFFTVYGPRQRPDLAIHKFARLLSKGEPICMYGDGTTSRDYTYVEDIVDGIVASLDRALRMPPEYQIFNLGGSETISLTALIQMLGDALGCTPTIERFPRQPGDVDHTWADITKATRLLGYRPRTPFRDGIRAFGDWFLGHVGDKATSRVA
jgi:nucleoside-diphosphate-sugar epimerase